MNIVQDEISRINARSVRSEFERDHIGAIVDWALQYTEKQFDDMQDMINTYWKELYGIEV